METRTAQREGRNALVARGGSVDPLSMNRQYQSRGAASVVFQESAGRLMADDLIQPEFIERLGRWQVAQDGHVADVLTLHSQAGTTNPEPAVKKENMLEYMRENVVSVTP